mgnify:CR=1 FL=1
MTGNLLTEGEVAERLRCAKAKGAPRETGRRGLVE